MSKEKGKIKSKKRLGKAHIKKLPAKNIFIESDRDRFPEKLPTPKQKRHIFSGKKSGKNPVLHFFPIAPKKKIDNRFFAEEVQQNKMLP